MANKAISELPQAQNVNNQDLFVLEQSGIAKKLPAETFITEQGIINALAEALDGHGGIQSVTLSSVSGRIRTYRITFTDQSATTFQVYDGTSIDRISRTSSSGLDDVYTIFLSDGTTTFFTVHNGADGTVSEAMLNDALKDKAPVITETTESSAIANFTDGADDLVMHNVVAEINPVQDLSNGDPSPSNICPISGHTEVTVTRAGKNLLPNIFYGGVPYNASVGTTFTPTVLDDVVQNGNTYTKTVTSWGSISMISEPLPLGTYKLNIAVTATSTRSSLYVLDDHLKVTRRIANSSVPIQWTNAITLSDGEKYIAVYLGSNSAGTVTYTAPQIEYGSTATAYEEYVEPTTVTVDWTTEAGTVYGGTIDVATGLLTVTHAMQLMTGASSEAWNLWDGKFVATISGIARSNSTSSNNRIIIADRFKSNGVQYRAGCGDGQIIKVVSANNYIACYSSVYTDINAFTASLGTNPMTVVYKLATPQTYQLTGQQLLTLLGTNNVWADTGNVSVTYPADTKLFIEKLTMPTEDDLVANQAITSGKYFMIGNSLYLALANIASGAQITIGTNAQRVSLADALNTINS